MLALVTALLRRDPIHRMPRWIYPICLFTVGLQWSVVALLLPKKLHLLGFTVSWNVILWAFFAFGLATARQRCWSFELALPIPARLLWRRHLVAILLAAMGNLAALAVGALAGNALARALIGHVVGLDTLLPLLARLTSVVVLGATLLQCHEPRRHEQPMRADTVLWAVLVGLGGAGLLSLLDRLPLVACAAPLLLAAGLARWTEGRLGGSLLIDGNDWIGGVSTPVSPRDRAMSTGWSTSPPRRSFARRLALRFRYVHFGIPLSIHTLSLAAIVWIAVPSHDQGFDAVTLSMLTIACSVSTLTLGVRLESLAHLPLSRRHLFHLLNMPSLITMSATMLAFGLAPEWWRLDDFRPDLLIVRLPILLGLVFSTGWFLVVRTLRRNPAGVNPTQNWRFSLFYVKPMVAFLALQILIMVANWRLAPLSPGERPSIALLQSLAATPLTIFATWTVCLLWVAVMYRWTLRRFERLDLLPAAIQTSS